MKIVFMGTPDFAEKSLKRLYDDGYDIVGVFTQADKPKNRGMKLSESPVKQLALINKTPVFHPVSLKDENSAQIIRDLNCDLIVVVAYGKKIPNEILEVPPLGCINIHGSLLPAYRGAAPIQYAVLNGDTETGLTSQYVNEEMDSGDIIFTIKTQIGDDETSKDLFERLSILGADLLSKTVTAISSGTAPRTPQDKSKVTYAPLLKKEMSPIDWNKSAIEIKAHVRGLIPWPVATTELGGVVLKVFSVDIRTEKHDKSPGTVLSKSNRGIEIICADGVVTVLEVQAPGGKRMSASDYINGLKRTN